MTKRRDEPVPPAPTKQAGAKLQTALAALRARTPARLIVGRAGPAYRTETLLELREDHAAAVDAVQAEVDLTRDFQPEFVKRTKLFEVTTTVRDKAEYLRRPELGRRLGADAVSAITERCRKGADLQVAIGDGLSAAAVVAQAPALLPLLVEGAKSRGWTFGQPFVIHHCRVGVLNDIGEALAAKVVVLLIGERPGLATAREPVGIFGVLPAGRAYRRAAELDFEHSCAGRFAGRGGRTDPGASRADAAAADERRDGEGATAQRGVGEFAGGGKLR